MRAVVHDRYGPPGRPPARGRREARAEGRRDPRSGSTRRPSTGRTAAGAPRTRSSPASSPASCGRSGRSSAASWRAWSRRSGSAVTHVRGRRRGLRHQVRGTRRVRLRAGERRRWRASRPAMSFEEAAAVCDGAIIALTCLRKAGLRRGAEHRRLRRLRLDRHCRASSWRSTSAPASRPCATRRTSSSCARSAPTRSSTTPAEDFTRNGETYDVVFDAVGKHSFRRCRRSVKRGGVYVETDLGFCGTHRLLVLLTRWIGDKRVTIPIPRYTQEEVVFLKELIEAGEYRAVIDRATRWRTSSRRRGTSRRGRRRATSS